MAWRGSRTLKTLLRREMLLRVPLGLGGMWEVPGGARALAGKRRAAHTRPRRRRADGRPGPSGARGTCSAEFGRR
jgi:hypothetical protein